MHKVHALIGALVCLAVMLTCLVHGASFEYVASTLAGGNGEFVDPQKIARLSNGDLIVSDAKGHSIKKVSNGVVTTIAGTGFGGFSGDNGNATAAQLNSPFGIAVLNDEIYFADRDNNRIRKIDLNGTITTIAGSDTASFTGDNDLAINAKLSKPMDVAFNAAGELLIADMDNYRIRKIFTNGTIVTIIGSGASGHTGDNGLAINAALSQAYGVRVHSENIYISDTHNFKIRMVVDGNISTIAGSGSATYNGDNISATSANLNNPTDVAFLSTGEMLIADTDNYRVRMVLTNGTIVTIAGNGTASFSETELASTSAFSTVTGILVVSDDEIYIADAGNARIRMLSIKQNKCFGVDASEASSCSGNGDCTAVDTCVCKQGWSGSNCNITSCFGVAANDNTVCSGHGSCSSLDACVCSNSWTGSNCNVSSGSISNPAATYTYSVSTFAGGNGEFVDPQKIARLSNGDLIVSDAKGHSIKKIAKDTKAVTTIAGTGVGGFSGDNSLATVAQLQSPFGIAVLNDEIYFADRDNNRIRKIDLNGTITTIAGTGTAGFSGDNDLAINAKLSKPMDVAFNAAGELLIADMDNYRIRKILTNGTIITIIGSGASGHTGDNGLAINAALSQAYGVRMYSNNIYVSDANNFKVRKVDTNQLISTIAGSGSAPFNGDNILATAANLNHPTDVAFLSTGEMLIADTDNYRVRMVLTNNTMVTVAGNGTASFSDGKIASSQGLSTVTGILVVSDDEIYIADAGNARIRLLSTKSTPQITCFGVTSGDSSACSAHGSCNSLDTCVCSAGWYGANCNITYCGGIASNDATVCNSHGSCVVYNYCVCSGSYGAWTGPYCNITSCGGVSSNDNTVCGGHGSCNELDTCVCTAGWTGANCNVSTSSPNQPAATYTYTVSTFVGGNGEFVDPQKIARLSNGDLIVSDAKGNSIKKISKATRAVTTIAGNGFAGYSGDNGNATAAQLNFPYGVAVLNDEIYIADSKNHRIRKIDRTGIISTIAGTGIGLFGDEGLAINAKFNTPMDVAFNAAGELLIVDMYNKRVRKIMTNGTITTIIGGKDGYSGDNGLAINAAMSNAYGVRVYSNNIYISDSNNLKVRKVDTNQIITTIAGSGSAPFNGDNILATSANLNHPTDVAFLSTGEMLIADTDNYRVRMVLTNGTIVTIAGNGTASFSDGKLANSRGMSTVTGILVVSDDEIYIADAGNARIRLLSTNSYTCNGIDFTDSSVCSGNGVCSSIDTCKCKQGWKGQYCNVVDDITCFGVSAISKEVCGGHGSCLSLDTCVCNTGYYGSSCTMQLQQCVNETLGVNTPCFGNGNCTNSGCVCNSGFYGKHCTFGFNIFASPITHAMLGIDMASQLEILLEYIDSIEYLWSQTSGPTISNLESLVGRLNGPTLHIPSKLAKTSLNNGLVAGQTYGFSLSAKITTKSQVFTATSSVSIAVLTDPKLTFLLQDASTNQNVTSGIAGTTQFKAIITSNSNQNVDPALQYGFGFSDGESITILTSLSSETSATFKLPFVAGQNSVDLYVACFGTNTRSVQKLTTISLTNPVSNLTPTQAVSAISNLISANSSATDLLGAASLLNTISDTGSTSDISAKTNIRSTIISSLSNIIATAELGPALKALSSVTTTTSEITEASANTAFTALLGATSNPTFSKNDLQSIINIASNVFTSSSDSASDKFSNTIAATLSKAISSGEIVSASSSNLEMAVAKALQSFAVGLNNFKFSSTVKRQGIVEVIVCSGIMYNGVCLSVIQIQISPNKRPARQPATKTRMTSSEDNYTVGSKTYDIKGILENGTAVHDGTIHGYLEITIPYTSSGTSVPVCGLLYDGEMVLDSSIITTVNSGRPRGTRKCFVIEDYKYHTKEFNSNKWKRKCEQVYHLVFGNAIMFDFILALNI